MPEQDFMEKPWYPVIFVIIISLIFIGVLATMYRYSEKGIEKLKKESYELAILGLCADTLSALSGKTPDAINAAYPSSFVEYFREMKTDAWPRRTFEVRFNDETIAYVFDVTGKGLWGTMRALVATDLTRETLLGLNVYDQMETPGLGSRIEEDWFTSQFKQKRAWQDGKPTKYILIPEGQQPIDAQQIKQVTGATITSRAVLLMLQDELTAIMKSSGKVQL